MCQASGSTHRRTQLELVDASEKPHDTLGREILAEAPDADTRLGLLRFGGFDGGGWVGVEGEWKKAGRDSSTRHGG